MEEEVKKVSREFSVGDVMRTILSRKFLALIIAVAITLVGTLALYFGYNATTNYYESSFTINFPVSAGGLIEYPDGKQRNFRDLISESNLKEVKASSNSLSGIDISDMLKKGGISISQHGTENASYFTLKVKAYYFSSENVAEIFIDAIINTVKNDLLNTVGANAKSVRSGFDKSLGNERKIDFLSKQIDYYTARFANIGSMPSDALTEINNITYTLNALKGILYNNFYETDAKALKSYANEYDELERQLKNAQAVLDNLTKAGADTTGGTGIDGTLIVEYTEKVNSLNNRIGYIKDCLEKHGSTNEIPDEINKENYPEYEAAKEFEKDLSEVLQDICALSEVYEAEHWKNYSAASYTGLRLNLIYGFRLIYCIIVSLIVGVVIAAIVAYSVAKKSEKKKVQAELTNEAGESDGEVKE